MGHHPGMVMPSEGIGNAPLPWWSVIVILAVIALLVYLGWRWLKWWIKSPKIK